MVYFHQNDPASNGQICINTGSRGGVVGGVVDH
jgi:hypothetical protein